MEQKKETLSEMDVRQQILNIQDKIDEELGKPECEIDMAVIDGYFKQIRELDGGVYEKSDTQITTELENICKKARKNKSRSIFWYINTTGKRVAAFFIVVGLLCGFSAGVYAIREPITEFFLNVKERFSEVLFNTEDIEKAPTAIDTVYTLGYVPEGYELAETSITEHKVNFVWENQDGEYIEFVQYILKNTSTIDTENSDYIVIDLNGTKVLCCKKQEIKLYFWNIGEYAFSLKVTTPMTNDDFIQIIESLTIYNN